VTALKAHPELPQRTVSVTHTPGHRKCPACELVRQSMIEPAAIARLTFTAAATVWIESHQRHIGEGTLRDYWNCIRALEKFFVELPLSEIHPGHFEQYQKQRLEGSGGLTKAGPSRVNHDLNTLSQILARAGLWAPIAPYYKPLKLPRPKMCKTLTDEQEKTLFQVAMTKPKWKVAYLCSLLTVNTTCNSKEIRLLRLMDVDLSPSPASPYGTIHITLGAKNDYRDRTIPLNSTANMALRELLKIALERGSVEPQHFLIAHRAPKGMKGWDPTQPATSWRKAWNKLRVAAGFPEFQMHHLRHHTITRLLEQEGVSERTVIELAGHVSRKMLDTYSHIRMKSKLEGVMALERIPAPEPEKKPPASEAATRRVVSNVQ
jgi:integrase